MRPPPPPPFPGARTHTHTHTHTCPYIHNVQVAQFGLSFYVLIVTASYTASLAGFLATASKYPNTCICV